MTLLFARQVCVPPQAWHWALLAAWPQSDCSWAPGDTAHAEVAPNDPVEAETEPADRAHELGARVGLGPLLQVDVVHSGR